MLLSCAAQSDETRVDGLAPGEPPAPPHSSRSLVERTLIKDYEIFRRFALKRVRNLGEAEDVLQSFCLKALERAHQLRSEEAVHGWLRRLFETTLLDHFRASARLNAKAFPLLQDRPPSDEIAGEAFLIDEIETVECVLSALRPGYAQIIRQMDLGQEDAADIAHRLAISPNNLAVRLHRARYAFREALAELPLAVQD